MNNAKGLFDWALKEGEAKIIDRVLIKVAPKLLAEGIEVSAEDIKNMGSFFVGDEIYSIMKQITEEIVGKSYEGGM